MAATTMKLVELDEAHAWSGVGRGGELEVEVLDGVVLVTVEGDRNDHVLAAGQRFRGPARRRVAATGLSPSKIRVRPPPAVPFERLAYRDGRKVARHLLGGALIVAVWLSLWTWVTLGVVGPLSALPPLAPAAASDGS